MTDAQKRQYVSELYSGPKWKKRVEKMNDDQVVAIYLSHLNDGEKPEHDEEAHDEEPEPHLDIPVMNLREPRDPHWNEDQFPIF